MTDWHEFIFRNLSQEQWEWKSNQPITGHHAQDMFLGSGWKLENPEETHLYMGEQNRQKHKYNIEPGPWSFVASTLAPAPSNLAPDCTVNIYLVMSCL